MISVTGPCEDFLGEWCWANSVPRPGRKLQEGFQEMIVGSGVRLYTVDPAYWNLI